MAIATPAQITTAVNKLMAAPTFKMSTYAKLSSAQLVDAVTRASDPALTSLLTFPSGVTPPAPAKTASQQAAAAASAKIQADAAAAKTAATSAANTAAAKAKADAAAAATAAQTAAAQKTAAAQAAATTAATS